VAAGSGDALGEDLPKAALACSIAELARLSAGAVTAQRGRQNVFLMAPYGKLFLARYCSWHHMGYCS
jgi:hypothetical protein